MKIQINTNKKTVQVLDDVNLFDLVKSLKNLLRDEYKDYTFIGETQSVYPWVYPVYIPCPHLPCPYIQPYYDYSWPQVVCDTGVYNIEIQGATTSITA